MQADVVKGGGSAVFARTVEGDLELSRQERELGVERGPLSQYFRQRTRIHNLIRCDACEFVRGDIPYAIAAGLDRMHLHAREVGEDVRRIFEPGPVVLNVLTRREVAVTAVVAPRNGCQHAQLA